LLKVANHPFFYMIDCGEAKSLSVKECIQTNALFISHTHIDHFSNFDKILRSQIGIGRRVVICGPKGITSQIQNRIKSYTWNLISSISISYEIREIINDKRYQSTLLQPPLWEMQQQKIIQADYLFEERDFKVCYTSLDHKTPSIAYLFEGNERINMQITPNLKAGKWIGDLKEAFLSDEPNREIVIEEKSYKASDLFQHLKRERGEKFGFILDHAANKANHELIKKTFSNADKIWIECYYKDQDKSYAKQNYHSYLSQSVSVMKAAKVKKAIPIHFSRKYSRQEINDMIDTFESLSKKDT